MVYMTDRHLWMGRVLAVVAGLAMGACDIEEEDTETQAGSGTDSGDDSTTAGGGDLGGERLGDDRRVR